VTNRIVVTWPVFDVDGSTTGARLTAAGCEIVLAPKTGARSADELVEILGDAAGVIASTDPFDASVFARCPNLRVIARTGVGVDAIDLGAATAAGVIVATTPGANEEAVADHALAMILALLRRLDDNDAAMRSGHWDRAGDLTPGDLSGATVGLLGCGAIGRAVIRRLLAFGSTVLVCDPYVQVAPDQTELVTLDELLERADVVTVHAPLTAETKGILGAAEIARLKPSAVVVNVARGGIVDETALFTALRDGALAGAALDTFTVEPPDITAFADVPHLILSPHIGGFSHRSIEAMTSTATTAVLDVLAGRVPATAVNPEAARD
jgi:phosphoglycerate dehydrogenase-like enzyme